MSDVVIQVENLSKQYRIGKRQARYGSLRESIMQAASAPLERIRNSGNSNRNPETIWALKDVSFEVKRGEVLGIIGRNGAGKSTLLKILSRITKPTEGKVRLRGRVGSLLEVGTGFHPELTGRENIYLNGAILGMRRLEIDSKYDEIVDFAEIEQFLDTPVKHYSSGMYMRLAFAVAAHLEPEILLVDEVLAVGDAAFQKKCLGKMSEVAKGGRTILFVSHNMVAVQNLCESAIWLDKGIFLSYDFVNIVTSKYLNFALKHLTEQIWDDMSNAPGNEWVRLSKVSVQPANTSDIDQISIRTPLILEFQYWNLKKDIKLNLSLHLYNEQGITVFNTTSIDDTNWFRKPHPKGLFRSYVQIPGDFLNDGLYRVTILFVRDQSVVVYQYDDILVFDISDSPDRRSDWYGKWQGVIRPKLEWRTEFLSGL